MLQNNTLFNEYKISGFGLLISSHKEEPLTNCNNKVIFPYLEDNPPLTSLHKGETLKN
jgi:hypothetical protein